MKIKPSLVILICLIPCLAGMVITASLAGKDKNLFLVLPTEFGSRRFDVQEIENFSEKEFLLSYEIPGTEKVGLSYAEYHVTVIATNSAYPWIMGFTMAEGSFFSKQAWAGKQRHAVLNETAAYAIFGSANIAGSRVRIRNDTWLVIGVISDGDKDKARVYIPSSVRGGEADALALKGVGNDAYVRTSLKALGIQDGSYSFIDLAAQCRLLWERAEVIILLFFALLLLCLIKPLIGGFREVLAAMKRELNRFYLGELLQKRGKSFHKTVFYILGLALFPTLALLLFLRLASVCLPWQDIPSLANLNSGFFLPQLTRIRILELISRFFFGFSLAILAIFFYNNMKRIKPRKRRPIKADP